MMYERLVHVCTDTTCLCNKLQHLAVSRNEDIEWVWHVGSPLIETDGESEIIQNSVRAGRVGE